MARTALFALLLLIASAPPLRAQESPPEVSPAEASKDEEQYWSRGTSRPFVSLDAEVGAYLHGTLDLGYGRPHWLWVGLETSGFVTYSFAAASVGLRANLLAADLQLNARRVWSFTSSTAPVAASHVSDDFSGAVAYTELEADLSGGLPAPHGFAIYDFELLHVTDMPAGQDLYEQWDHVVTNSGSLFSARAGYLLAFGRAGFFKIGPMADITASFGRGTSVRAGVVGSIGLTDHLDIAGLLLWPARGPDSLGFKGTYAALRLRWTWASGEERPGFF